MEHSADNSNVGAWVAIHWLCCCSLCSSYCSTLPVIWSSLFPHPPNISFLKRSCSRRGLYVNSQGRSVIVTRQLKMYMKKKSDKKFNHERIRTQLCTTPSLTITPNTTEDPVHNTASVGCKHQPLHIPQSFARVKREGEGNICKVGWVRVGGWR